MQFCSMKLRLSARTLPGFSLIELMTAMAITGLLAGGIFTLLNYAQRTNIKVINTFDIASKIDEAELFIRARTGPADRLLFDNDSVIDNGTSGSVECLLLQRRVTTDRTGLSLREDDDFLEATGYKGVGNEENFSLAFWFKRSNTISDNESMVSWGDYDATEENSLSIHLTPNGRLSIDFGAENAQVSNPSNLDNDKWHHVLLTYDNSSQSARVGTTSMQLYVDGVKRTLTLSSTTIPLLILTTSAADDFTVGKGNTGQSTNNFEGSVSDLRLFSSVTSAGQAWGLYESETDPSGGVKQLHWQLDNISNNMLVDTSPSSRNGTLINSDATNPIFTTSEESYIGDVFAMVDPADDDNDFYELMHSTTRIDCPESAADIEGFTAATEDIFTREPAVGFFSQSDNLSTNILFNYGFGQSDTNRTRVSSIAKTRKLTTTQKFTNLDLCRAAPNMTFTPPTSSNCGISQAFAYIALDFDNITDELFIPNAQYWPDNTTYHSIAFAPDSVYAEWASETGVMRFYTQDGTELDTSVWEDVLSQIAYRPTSDNYVAEKTLVVSLGYLPMSVNGEYHFYDFIESPAGTTVGWEASRTAAFATQFCGTNGYLATVTSEEENDFLIERFRKTTGSVPAGWLGGSDSGTPGQWVWENNSPEAGLRFWHQTSDTSSAGRPVYDNGTSVPDGTYTLQDMVREPGTASDSFMRRITNSTDPQVTLAYHNWADREPNDVGNAGGNGEPYLQIVGSSAGNGYWNDLPDTLACVDDEKYAPCGYYIEFGGRPGESLNSIVFEATIDLSKQREFCEQ